MAASLRDMPYSRSGVRQRQGWISGPVADVALALCWVPCALVAHAVEGSPAVLRSLVGAVMFLSFAHQPLTLPLVYGSPWRLSAHRRLFLWCPVVALAVVVVASQVAMVAVAVVGALWNAEHTVMQRYGITRIYGRRAGDDQARIEKVLYLGWLLLPLLWITANGELPGIVSKLSTGNIVEKALPLLARLSAQARLAVPVLAIGLAVVTVQWLAGERRAGPNPAKRLYVASTVALLATATIDPIAAVVGLVASHSVEYFVIVNRSVTGEAAHQGPLGTLVRRRHGRAVFFGAYAAAATSLFLAIYRLAQPRALLVAVLTIGALHFFYDSFIWKLRRPEVAASLAGAASVVA